MPDPGTAVGIASWIYDVGKDLYQYYMSCQDCENDVRKLRSQLLWLNQTFDSVTKTLKHAGLDSEDRDRVSSAVINCREPAVELQAVLKRIKLDMGNPQNSLARIKAYAELSAVHLMYPFRQSTIDKLLANIQRCCNALDMALSLLGLDTIATTLQTMRAIDWKVTNGQATLEHELQQLQLSQRAFNAQLASNAARLSSENTKGFHSTCAAIATLGDRFTIQFDGVQQIFDSAEDARKAQSIIASLDSAVLHDRRQQIPDAQGSTLEWMLSDDVSGDQDSYLNEEPQFRKSSRLAASLGPENQLAHWLEHESGIFWICGKVGSGKSTLMKFLSSHERLEELLSRWAGDSEPIILDHYFWISGTSLQKSYEGMLQSLLHQILKADPALVPVACDRRWTSPRTSKPWNTATLFKSLNTALRLSRHSICVILDGLDEYHPDSGHAALVRNISALASYTNVKLIVSSRQWPAFERAFGNANNKLMLQDVNRRDIVDYIRDKFRDNSMGQIPSKFDWAFFYRRPYRSWEPGYKGKHKDLYRLVDDLVHFAEGVFLWVTLVTETLCERLRGGATVTQLQEKISVFPKSLEDYFRTLVHDRINDTWAQERAIILDMMLIEDLLERPRIRLYFIWLVKQRGPALFLDEQWYLNLEFRWCLGQDLDHMVQEVNERLAVCCKDLVTPAVLSSGKLSGIEFTHRTVRDFLTTETMHELLNSELPDHFQDCYKASRLYLMAAKCNIAPYATLRQSLHPDFSPTTRMRLDSMPDCMLDDHIFTFIDFMQHLEDTGRESSVGDREYLISLLSAIRPTLPFKDPKSARRLLMVPVAPFSYQEESQKSSSALLTAIGFDTAGKWTGCPVNLDQMTLALQQGSNPNDDRWQFRTFHDSESYYISIWHRFLVQPYNKQGGCWDTDRAWEIAKILLEHGAEANVHSMCSGTLMASCSPTRRARRLDLGSC